MSITFKNVIQSFIFSSYFSIITIFYLLYFSIINNKKLPYQLNLFVLIFLLYGLFGLINYLIISLFGPQYSFIIGILFGVFLSIIGRFYLNLPINLFNYTKNTEYKVHIIAPLLYALIFQFIITPLLITYIL